MNISVPIENSLEFIEVTPVSPLISKCQIKVCYVQDEPNRNGSVITKETAKEMANTLPGCPIVGFYNESNEDFEGHNQSIKIGNGEVEVKDTTIPYGFVDMNPRVWFQQFADGPNHEIHEYLMTEGYIWSGQFPEAKRILTKGNNQSMELDDRFVDGKWAESEDGYYSFFIINDAVISKLCVLGEDVEPCFEGAQIKAQFSLDDFNQKFKTMAYELKQILGEGGQEMEEIVQNEEMIQEEPVIEEEFANENEIVEEIVDIVVESTEDENFKKNIENCISKTGLLAGYAVNSNVSAISVATGATTNYVYNGDLFDLYTKQPIAVFNTDRPDDKTLPHTIFDLDVIKNTINSIVYETIIENQVSVGSQSENVLVRESQTITFKGLNGVSGSNSSFAGGIIGYMNSGYLLLDSINGGLSVMVKQKGYIDVSAQNETDYK